MSFSSRAKEEIAGIVPQARHCREAALCAVMECAGGFLYEGSSASSDTKPSGIRLDSDNHLVQGKFFTILQKATNICFTWQFQGVKGEITDNDADGAGIAAVYEICQKTDRLLEQRECCRRAWLREVFLCTGSVTDPAREYHMEFACGKGSLADRLIRVLSVLGIPAKETRRKNNRVVYIKDSAAIGDVLSLTGAHTCYLELENALILKDMRNSINRRVNFETANIVKAVGAAQRQIDDIRLLEKRGVLKTLPETLQQIASVRLQYPDATLKELGASLNPPVGKSGVNHRLRRLQELAAQSDDLGG